MGRNRKNALSLYRHPLQGSYPLRVESQDLIAETNALLRQLLERDDERKQEAAKAHQEFEAKMKEIPSAPAAAEEDNFSKRMANIQEQSKQRMEELRLKDLEYKDLMLSEVREQTQLLRAIREKLEA